MKFPGRSFRKTGFLFPVVFAIACSDFATTPDRIPDALLLEPYDTIVTQGDEAPLRLTVLDQNGEAFPSIPPWASPQWKFSEPGAVVEAPDGTLEAVGGGELWVEAQLAGLKALTKLRVNPKTVILSAPRIYLIQSAQNLQGDVPLIAGVDGLLRVFVNSEPASFYQPRVRASFYHEGREVHSVTLSPRHYLIPHEIQEGLLDRSFNAPIPGGLIQPGLELVVELDVDAVVPLAPGSGLRIPTDGRMALDVRTLPPFELTIVPTLQAASPDPGVLDWVAGLTPGSPDLEFVQSVLPMGELDLEIHESYTTSADLTTDDGWTAFLREMSALRIADGSNRYYYGATVLPAGSAVGGLGYVGRPASTGRPTAATLAHELGHNLSLRHAPCGGVSSYDSSYPYPNGSIGIWGYVSTSPTSVGSLRSPEGYRDLMGYCNPKWISDYHFKKAMDFRFSTEPLPPPQGDREKVLLLWGSTGKGKMLLEPSFVLDAPRHLPSVEGPFRLEGRDDRGGILFSLSFVPDEVESGDGHFAFALPLGEAERGALDSITLTGPGEMVTVDRETRLPLMSLVTDDRTGRIRAILRNGMTSTITHQNVSVRVSDGLPEWGGEGRQER